MSLTADLSGKTALVTGASSGLGVHFAKTLAAAGARVAVAARRVERLQALCEEIASSGGNAIAVAMDVTDSNSVDAAFDDIADRLAAPDVIVNNSGISDRAFAIKLEEEEWDRVIDTNLKGAWMVSKAGANRLIADGRPGTIINIASILSFRVSATVPAYAASKAGLAQLTKAMSLELARHQIRVNAIAPGYVETEMNSDFFASEPGLAMIKRIPQRRLGTVEDLEGPLLLLASDASQYMTGSVVVVDGGHLQSSL
ncbi:MAG: glucose 1-dehydrogenase [Pseudomonadota bacterium]